jgi:NAD(P)-dependent dehydrogenase (short-subunit alcohol dehydrogenase family)
LENHGEVVSFGRSESSRLKNRVRVDFGNTQDLREALSSSLHSSPPDGIVFAQRYRPKEAEPTLDSVLKGILIELGPLFSLIEILQESGRSGPLNSIVMFSSTAAHSAHMDVPVYYHLLKAATLNAVLAQVPVLGRLGIRINAIIPGDFMKYPLDTYTEIEKARFKKIQEISLSGRCGTVADILEMTEFLLFEKSSYVTGQFIHVDGGAHLISTPSYIRINCP